MRRTEQLIGLVRKHTENTRVGTTDGISDDEFIQFLNEGQENLLASIFQTNARAFSKAVLLDMTRGVAEYPLPSDTFLNSRIVLVEFTQTGSPKDFYPLKKNAVSERRHYEGFPGNYIILGGNLVISPSPDRSIGSGIRVTYDPIFPRIDKRRTTVSARTISVGKVTSLTLSTASPFVLGDYSLFDHLSFVDSLGLVKSSKLNFTDVSAGGVVTMVPGGHTLLAGETVDVGDYVVLGPYASTHSMLPDVAEKYLTNYCSMRIFGRDSSSDMSDQKMLLDEIESKIIQSYEESSGDIDEVIVADYTYYPEV